MKNPPHNTAQDATIFCDARGLLCPLPSLKLQKYIAPLKAGEVVALHTTDPMAAIDIPHFCTERGHKLLTQHKNDEGEDIFLIEKSADTA